MKWVVSMLLLALTASCSNYADEVDAISTDVELLNDELDRIGERQVSLEEAKRLGKSKHCGFCY